MLVHHVFILHLPPSFVSTTSFQMSVIFRLAYGRRVRTLQDDIVVANIKAGGCEYVP